MSKKAIILFSGGLDSTTCLAMAKSEGFDCYALSFQYDQKHLVEMAYAKKIAKDVNVIDHQILHLPLFSGDSSLTNKKVSIADYQGNGEIPSTYVPARNTIFLSFAIGWAEVIHAEDIFMGANILDYSGYPDCRPHYLRAFETMANLAMEKTVTDKMKIRIHAPLITLNKAQIIQKGIGLGVDYSKTISCYRANAEGLSCGTCDSCFYRKKGFEEAHMIDPTRYIN